MKKLIVLCLVLCGSMIVAAEPVEQDKEIGIVEFQQELLERIEALEIALGLRAEPMLGCSCPVMENCDGHNKWIWWCSEDCCWCYRQTC